ncbi:replication protein A3 [Babesia caballi]|nr:replication protein A3 [Babesia caballi]
MNGDNLVMQTPDGAKVMCVVGQNAGLKTMQVVEIYAVVLSGANRSEHNLYLQQYGQIYRWDDMTNMGHLDSAIKLMDHPRIAKHIRFPADNCANY